MKESVKTVLWRTTPGDSWFRNEVISRKEGETLGEHLIRIAEAMNIEVVTENDLSEKLAQSDVVIVNHPTSIDIIIVGIVLGDSPYTVVTQRKRAPALKELFGEATICPVPLGRVEYSGFINTVKRSLSEGRKLVLFPTGGSEIMGEGDSWFPLYKDLIKSDIVAGKTILPLRINTTDAAEIQKKIGDKEKGREIFPEIHYSIPEDKTVISVTAGNVFVADENAEKTYSKVFASEIESGV